MLANLLNLRVSESILAPLLRPEPDAQGFEPERRVALGGISWDSYISLDQALGDDRPSPRLYYLDGELEIMTTSNEHERIKEWIGDLLTIFFDQEGMEIMPRGQATMRMMQQAGAEPDKSWCIGAEGEWPDLVLEIALSSGGLRKLAVYRRFDVPEVWLWGHDRLSIHALRDDGSAYEAVEKSRLLPALDPALLERCVAIRNWQEARRVFRAGLAG